jgi:hypothetical protein
MKYLKYELYEVYVILYVGIVYRYQFYGIYCILEARFGDHWPSIYVNASWPASLYIQLLVKDNASYLL